MAVSNEKKIEALERFKRGYAARAVAREVAISVPTAIRLHREFLATGTVTTKEWRHTRSASPSKAPIWKHWPILEAMVAADPGANAPSLAAELDKSHGVSVHPETIRRNLTAMGYEFG